MSFDLSYEKGLRALSTVITPDHERFQEFDGLQTRLRLLIAEERQLGPSSDNSVARNRVLLQLLPLSMEVVGETFSDLNTYGASIIQRPSDARRPSKPVRGGDTDDLPFISPEPGDEVNLESYVPSKPDLQDVGFIREMSEMSRGVCLIKLNAFARSGTGFLIAKDLVLTNYHVLCADPQEQADQNANEVRVVFDYVSSSGGTEIARTFRLHPTKPILEFSPVNELDFVLLRIEEAFLDNQGRPIQPLKLAQELPPPRSTLYILQHSDGREMNFTGMVNGVIGNFQNKYVQYVADTSGGSSGAPCFNRSWNVIALHRSSRARGFRIVREGVLMRSIYPRISAYL